MILFDIPLLLMIPLILFIGVILLFLLGAITPADFKSIFKRGAEPEKKSVPKAGAPPEKKSFLQRLDDIKFFEKPTSPAQSTSAVKKAVPGAPEPAPGIAGHVKSFITSLSSLGSVLKERSKKERKVEDINKLLDKTVSEKVKTSALADAANIGGPGGTGAIPVPPGGGKEEDLFLSLSGEEFDAGLLDELDDHEKPAAPSEGAEPTAPVPAPSGSSLAEAELSMPALDISSESDENLKENMPGLEEFSGLEGGDSIDQDFDDLENLSVDDVNLDEELPEEAHEEKPEAKPLKEIPEPEPAEKSGAVKSDWVASDAPGAGSDQISTQADMASFASGSHGTDEDLLSSIASEVKTVKKEIDISLVRELKDFKAPATDIEKELTDMYSQMQVHSKSGKVNPQADKEEK